MDGTCAAASFRSCPFASATVRETTTATSFTPAIPLDVSASRPVGRVYAWRVRACATVAYCSAWSEIRYLRVGRSDDDFDGDGFGDVVLRDPRGRVFVISGTSERSPSMVEMIRVPDPATAPHLDPPSFGFGLAKAGDVNGDGYADVVIGDPGAGGVAYVYLGGRGGLPPSPSFTLENPRGASDGGFGLSVAGVGDVDGDGYADVVISAPYQNEVFVYRGGSAGVVDVPALTIPRASAVSTLVAGAGDVDGDGYPDVLLSVPSRGEVFLHLGGAAGLANSPARELRAPGDFAFWGLIGAAGDINGDGYSDFAVWSTEEPVVEVFLAQDPTHRR
ncbi:MAG: VCBS repeat-containing protein [Sandaracinaceae bacterium]|nr:VCBS repeat-containing protein [Sandaracinaceae bacterium]